MHEMSANVDDDDDDGHEREFLFSLFESLSGGNE